MISFEICDSRKSDREGRCVVIFWIVLRLQTLRGAQMSRCLSQMTKTPVFFQTKKTVAHHHFVPCSVCPPKLSESLSFRRDVFFVFGPTCVHTWSNLLLIDESNLRSLETLNLLCAVCVARKSEALEFTTSREEKSINVHRRRQSHNPYSPS